MTPTALLVLKITLTPILVALMSLAAKRFGPTFGGLIMGLPWMTGPILLFLALEKGPAFGASASIGVLMAVVSIAAFLLTYAWCARAVSWAPSLIAATIAFAAVGYAATYVQFDAIEAAGLGVTALVGAFLAMPRLAEPAGPRPMPWWDIPMRMLATAVMVAIISFAADRIGARVSGVVASFPVITIAVGCFSHARWGAAAVVRILRAMTLSLIAFVGFFTVLSLALTRTEISVAFALATVVGVGMSAVFIFASRRAARHTVAGADRDVKR